MILIWHRMNHQTHHLYYLNISVQVANLSDWRIESNRNFLPELECSSGDGAVRQTWAGPSIRCSATSSDVNRCPLRVVCRSNIFFWCCRGSLARRSARCRRQIYSVVRRGGFGGGGGGRPVVGRIEMCESFISETVF